MQDGGIQESALDCTEILKMISGVFLNTWIKEYTSNCVDIHMYDLSYTP